jgi:hypothetical protein
MLVSILSLWPYLLGCILLGILIIPSIHKIGQTEVGLVTKRYSFKKLQSDDPIAFIGEAGYQAELLMPGWRFKFWIVYHVSKHPLVQISAGEIGVVIAQVGEALPIGAKSAIYKKEFGNYTDLEAFLQNGGQKGVQRPVLPPGTIIPMHPVAFMVITGAKTFGVPVSEDLKRKVRAGKLGPESFGLSPEDFKVTKIMPHESRGHKEGEPKKVDLVGVVTVKEGKALSSGNIASRLGGFEDIRKLEEKGEDDATLMETVLGSKNEIHDNYQDFQAFLDNGGKIGLQHDVLLWGAYNLNPFLVSVELVPMLVIEQGEVAVIKSYVGLGTEDTSGETFMYGSLVKPGHRGIWQEPLRTGKFPINPHCYDAIIVPTYILTLNWAEATSEAHSLDSQLSQIDAKSIEGFEFRLDLQVQIHIPDTQAPHVISMVGTIANLVNEVLQAAVGNHFRDKLQSLEAVKFIEERQQVQEEAFIHIKGKLDEYKVETKGVYIQDVIFPPQLVKVLTEREVAHQEIATFKKQEESEKQRISTENARGTADMQSELAKSTVSINIKENNAKARKSEAEGEATYIEKTGAARSAEVRAVGLAKAEAYQKQVDALGQSAVSIITVAEKVSESGQRLVPDVFVAGGNGGSLDGLAGVLTGFFRQKLNEANKATDTLPVNGPDDVDEPEKPTNEKIKASEEKKAEEDKKE